MSEATIQEIEDIQYPLVTLPFAGVNVIVKLRELNQAQIYACGGNNFSLIETVQDKIRIKKKPKLKDIVSYAEIQNAIAKKALVSPTYDEIFEICAKGFDRKQFEKDMQDIEELIAKTPRGAKQKALLERLDNTRVWYDLLLPEDFLSGITSYALSVAKSDIKELTRETLLNAAYSARKGHDNPADHISGNFTDFNKEDINRRAWGILHEEESKKRKRK